MGLAKAGYNETFNQVKQAIVEFLLTWLKGTIYACCSL
jgi:hypothetical protein